MRPLTTIVALVLVTAPAVAMAEQSSQQAATPDDLSQGELLCIFRPAHDCDYSVHGELAIGGGRVRGIVGPTPELPLLHLSSSLGVLFAVEGGPLQLGPVVSFMGYLDPDGSFARPALAASFFLRVWLGQWVNFDLTAGASLTFDDDFYAVGAGGVGEISIGLHGHVGAYFQAHLHGGLRGMESFVTGGIKGSFISWGALFAVAIRSAGSGAAFM